MPVKFNFWFYLYKIPILNSLQSVGHFDVFLFYNSIPTWRTSDMVSWDFLMYFDSFTLKIQCFGDHVEVLYGLYVCRKYKKSHVILLSLVSQREKILSGRVQVKLRLFHWAFSAFARRVGFQRENRAYTPWICAFYHFNEISFYLLIRIFFCKHLDAIHQEFPLHHLTMWVGWFQTWEKICRLWQKAPENL